MMTTHLVLGLLSGTFLLTAAIGSTIVSLVRVFPKGPSHKAKAACLPSTTRLIISR
jgi:hypothetical protein